jgi:NTE family protein
MGESQKTAFVLSGGASLGAVQAGMLQALYERDVAPDLIVGASVGALNGAFIASRPAIPETAQQLADLWRGLSRGNVFPLDPLTGFLGFFGARDHFVPDGALRKLVAKHLELRTLEDSPIPFVATELLSGRELRLSSGDAPSAVIASAAIPGVFPPVERDGALLIDGGVSDNTPIVHAIELGAERVYVLPTGVACDLREAPRGAIDKVLHAMSMLVLRRMLVEIVELRDRAELIVLPPPCPLRITPIDFSHGDELIRRGYEDSCEYLDAVARGEAPVPLLMEMHQHSRPAG